VNCSRLFTVKQDKWGLMSIRQQIGIVPFVRASPVCDPAKKYFSHPSLVIYFFFNPTYKSESGTPIGWGNYLLPNSKPPGPITMMSQSETLTVVRSYLLHSFLQVHNLVDPFTLSQLCWAKIVFLSQNCCNYVEPKLFSSVKPAYFFDIFSSNCTVQIMYWVSTTGHAL
jgi:hypothetical protein